MAVVRGKTPMVDRSIANTVPTLPNGLYAVAALTMLTLALSLALGYFFDAPLTELANPLVPENPAKAPWYFLGLQELVSYSAFMGGVAIPAIVVLGLMLVPYLDRERQDIGVWFKRFGREADLSELGSIHGGGGRRNVGLHGELRLAANVVARDSADCDHAHQPRHGDAGDLRSVVVVRDQDHQLDKVGSVGCLHLFPRGVRDFDLLRDRASRTELGFLLVPSRLAGALDPGVLRFDAAFHSTGTKTLIAKKTDVAQPEFVVSVLGL